MSDKYIQRAEINSFTARFGVIVNRLLEQQAHGAEANELAHTASKEAHELLEDLMDVVDPIPSN